MANRSRALKIGVPLGLLALGAGVIGLFVATRPEPEREPPEERVVPVTVVEARRTTARVQVRARGNVTAARRVDLVPLVSGSVVWVSDDLVPGKIVEEEQKLVRIDPRDYRLAVRARRGKVRRAELELRKARNRVEVAKREWELYGDERAEQGDPALALKLPQVASAEQALESARSQLQKARLDLARTTVEAPFRASIESESVAVGQRVSPQAPIASLVGVDHYRVVASVDQSQVDDVEAASPGGNGGPPARVIQTVDGERFEWPGRVVRVLPDLAPEGNMARVLVDVENPLGLDAPAQARKLLLDSFVEVRIGAEPLEDVIPLPRTAVRPGNRVFVADADGRLRIREVTIAWRGAEVIHVARGIEEGDRVITTRIPSPVEGMRVKVDETDPLPSPREPSPDAASLDTHGGDASAGALP